MLNKKDNKKTEKEKEEKRITKKATEKKKKRKKRKRKKKEKKRRGRGSDWLTLKRENEGMRRALAREYRYRLIGFAFSG